MNKFIPFVTKILLSALVSSIVFVSPVFAKDYLAQDINGKNIHFSIPSNKWIVINYWATWCSACVEEIPELNKVANVLTHKQAIFFSVNFEGLPANQLRSFASHYGMAYPVTRFNPIANLVDQDNFSSIPVTVVISPRGNVNVLHGEQSVSDILNSMA